MGQNPHLPSTVSPSSPVLSLRELASQKPQSGTVLIKSCLNQVPRQSNTHLSHPTLVPHSSICLTQVCQEYATRLQPALLVIWVHRADTATPTAKILRMHNRLVNVQ